MKSMLRPLAIGLAMASSGVAFAGTISGASGSDTSWGVHDYVPQAEIGFGTISGNGVSFAHDWLFTLTQTSNGNASAISNPLFSPRPPNPQTIGITNAQVGLYLDNGPAGFDSSDTLIGTLFSFADSVSGTENYNLLAPGAYLYHVTGVTNRNNGGNYTLNSAMEIAPADVPLPSTAALLALSALGLALRKRHAK